MGDKPQPVWFYKSFLIYRMCQCGGYSSMSILIHNYKNILIPARWNLGPLGRHKTWFGSWSVWFMIMNAFPMSKVSNTTHSNYFPTVPNTSDLEGCSWSRVFPNDTSSKDKWALTAAQREEDPQILQSPHFHGNSEKNPHYYTFQATWAIPSHKQMF